MNDWEKRAADTSTRIGLGSIALSGGHCSDALPLDQGKRKIYLIYYDHIDCRVLWGFRDDIRREFICTPVITHCRLATKTSIRYKEWHAVSWWRHQMETFSALLALCAGPVNSPHKGQWLGALMLTLFCAWINDWVMLGLHRITTNLGPIYELKNSGFLGLVSSP